MHRQGQAHYTLQPKSAAGMLGKDQRNEPEGPRNARPARTGVVVALQGATSANSRNSNGGRLEWGLVREELEIRK